ncbi:MAG: PQQ-like beta-propeller repeat protein [Phycisphaerales bacterium]|nr:PQQ-like beta-propeller repeat protein [Phycisphaerales bacterium]
MATFFMLWLGVTNASLGQWPQWGGPTRNFKAETKDLAICWPENGPALLWRRPLGDGYSSIIVHRNRLFTMYRDEEDEVIIALSPKTGRTVWEHRYSAPVSKEDFARRYGIGPRSTPLVMDHRIYAIGFNGTLHCLDEHTGASRWRIELLDRFGGNKTRWGYACSPLAHHNLIIVFTGGRGASVVALEADSGRVIWKRHDFKNSYASPILIDVDGEQQLVCFMTHEIAGLDPNDGRLKWRHPHENQWRNNVVTPVWGAGNMLFLSSEGHGGSRVLKLSRRGTKTNVRELWHTQKLRISHRNAIRIGDYIYGSHGDFGPRSFDAVHVMSGEFAWRNRNFSKSGLVWADGKFLMLDEDGNLTLATATPEKLTLHAKAKLLEHPAWTIPTLVGHHLYLRDRKVIMAVELP